MQVPADQSLGEPADAFVRFRYAMLSRASGLLEKTSAPHADGDGNGNGNGNDTVREVTSLLATSLEELKVAEEELRSQNTQLLKQRQGADEQLKRYRDLFVLSPVPALVTDIAGTIQELNVAAGRLVRRAPDLMLHKPLAALVAPDTRDEFRRKLSRLMSDDDSPRDWRFSLVRGNDVPVDVCATVQRMDEAPGKGRLLYWLLFRAWAGDAHVWDFDSR